NDVPVDNSLASAMAGYRQFLEATPNHAMAPEAMRRLADLEVEKDYGVRGKSPNVVELPVPDVEAGDAPTRIAAHKTTDAAGKSAPRESDAAFEARATAQTELRGDALDAADLPRGADGADLSGPRQAIETYKKILADYPWYERNDQVLYQMARAYDEIGDPDEAMRVIDRLVSQYPQSKYLDEVYFRRGEYYFVRRKYADAEAAYQSVVSMGQTSSFYELSLYKLGWSLYKREFYDDALHSYFALLDYKVASGYDFDAQHSEEEARRVEDTLQVVSLSLSNLGGPEVIGD